MTQDDDSSINQWDLIRAFLALERRGDYGIASEFEGIDDSTLRRRIRTLEHWFCSNDACSSRQVSP